MISKVKKTIIICILAIHFVLLLMLELFNDKIFSSLVYGDLYYSIITRFIGGTACLLFICIFSSIKFLSPKTTLKKMLLFLPCMLVAVNNFPFITFFTGEAYINSTPLHIILYALLCLTVGYFEEMAFRGCIFSVILQRIGKRRIDVFISIVLSSGVFGLIHLVNLLAGASIGSVILQIGYSFLIGGMCSVILIKTGNIWYCVLLHAVYNFAGGVVPECGGGIIWPISTIILTAVIAIIVAAYVIYLLFKITPEEIDALFSENYNN